MTNTRFIARTRYGVPIANGIFDTRAEALEWAARCGVEFPGYVIVEHTVIETERTIRRDRRGWQIVAGGAA